MGAQWGLGLPQPNAINGFFQGMELGRQHRRENALLALQQRQVDQQQEAREAQTRAGKHIAIGDMTGARAQAAESGNLDLVQAVNRLTADQRAEAAAQAQTLAPVYNRLRRMPYDQRRQELQRVAPALAARGIPPDMIASYDPTDEALDSDISLAMTLEQQLDQDRIHWQVIPGVGAFARDSMGNPVVPGQRGAASPAIPQAEPQAGLPTAQAAQPTGYAAGVGETLAQAGVPVPVVAGILGNGEHESGGRWNAAVGDNGTAHGAFQWRNERVDNFQRIIGVHPSQASPQQTAQFVLWELQNPEAAGMTREQAQQILNAPDAPTAARLFSRYYERPNPRLAHDERRIDAANRYAGSLQGQPIQTAQAGPVPPPGQPRSIQDQAATGVIQAPRQAPPGYEWTPQGQLRAIAGGPGDRTYERGREATTDQRESRREIDTTLEHFQDDPEVRQFRQARVATMQIRNLGQSGSPADDVALIFSFMRALDPSSTVREGEAAMAQQTAGIPDRIRTLYNQAVSGARLSPQQRSEFIATAERLYLQRARSYNEIANAYRERLRAMGVPEERIGPLVPTAEGPQREDRRRASLARGRAGAGVGAGTTRSGVRWRRVN